MPLKEIANLKYINEFEFSKRPICYFSNEFSKPSVAIIQYFSNTNKEPRYSLGVQVDHGHKRQFSCTCDSSYHPVVYNAVLSDAIWHFY